MLMKSRLAKTTALTLAASMFASGLLPIAQASAHDRHHAAKHGSHPAHWNKRAHRHFHKHYGRGEHGVRHYNDLRRQTAKRKKSNKGDLIAAGVIGLALGAIIASESKKQRGQNTYSRPAPQPTYQYDGYGQQHNPYQNPQRIQLNQHGEPVRQIQRYNEPEVITFRDSASLEPWTPGWRDWCSNRYRSFNVQTGTFRGYDGLDHFCVPK